MTEWHYNGFKVMLVSEISKYILWDPIYSRIVITKYKDK